MSSSSSSTLAYKEQFIATQFTLLFEGLEVLEGGAVAVLHVQQRHFVLCLHPYLLM